MSSTDLPSTVKIVNYCYHIHKDQAILKENAVYHKILNLRSVLYIFDATDTEKNTTADTFECAFVMKAAIIPVASKQRLQSVKLISNMERTFQISLDFSYKLEDRKIELVSLNGRNTSENRAKSRKILLSGLAAAKFSGSIEEARDKILYHFSNDFITSLYKLDDKALVKPNTALTYAWLIKLLG